LTAAIDTWTTEAKQTLHKISIIGAQTAASYIILLNIPTILLQLKAL
jgi:hypothetical protein